MAAQITPRHGGHAAGTFHTPSTSDEAEYDRLRSLAHAAQAKRNSCFERSRAAYASGQKALAKELSNEGKEYDRVGDGYHKQARDYIFRVNNTQRASDEIDLHGLYVHEAKEILGMRIRVEQNRGAKGLHVIVGKGNHSDGGIQKLKPAVEDLCRELYLQYSTEQNTGRMYISLIPVEGEHAGEVPDGIYPHSSFAEDHQAYALQPLHASSGEFGGGLNGQPGSYSGGFGSSTGHQHQQQGQQHGQQHGQQQQQAAHPGVAEQAEPVAKTFFQKLVGCCVVM